MKPIAWLFKFLLKAAIFFTLFAFALNNQSDVTVRFFFGRQWTTPMVLVVLGAFTAGLLVGVMGMVPRWWRQHRMTEAADPAEALSKPAAPPSTTVASGYDDAHLHGI